MKLSGMIVSGRGVRTCIKFVNLERDNWQSQFLDLAEDDKSKLSRSESDGQMQW